jgi:hypothetical protein
MGAKNNNVIARLDFQEREVFLRRATNDLVETGPCSDTAPKVNNIVCWLTQNICRTKSKFVEDRRDQNPLVRGGLCRDGRPI